MSRKGPPSGSNKATVATGAVMAIFSLLVITTGAVMAIACTKRAEMQESQSEPYLT